MTEKNDFDIQYKRLNKAQKEAVDTIDGPVMVVAGPGTGKTQILSLRIANILSQTDTDPENILALTFTESGVASMRKRLASIIGSPAYSVCIKTFHGFSNDVIKNNPEDFPKIIGSKNITEVEQTSLIEEVIQDEKLDILKPFGDTFYYVRPVLSAISNLKREGISVEDFKDIVEKAESDFEKIEDLYYEKGAHEGKMRGKYKDLKKDIDKNKELLKIYTSYERLLNDRRLYDYNDMIMEVLRALRENEDLLLRLQEEYQYILVDEHQDTNNAQNKILELLANFHENPNLFVVGDEKQSIFKFQGASLENFYYFKHLYPEAKLITLEENYRSTQKILDSAHSLIPGKTALKSNRDDQEKNIHFYSFKEDYSERYFIARDIEEKIKDGVTPSEIAVLYRNNSDAFPVADMLSRFGLPYVIESDQDLLSDKNIRKFLTILRSVNDFGEEEPLAEMLHMDLFEIDPLDLVRVLRAVHQKRKYDLFDVISNKDKELEKIALDKPEAFIDVSKKLKNWVTSSKNDDLITCLENIFRESGLLVSVLAEGGDRLEVINKIFDEAREIVNKNPEARLKEFFDYIETIKKHNISIKKPGFSAGDRVRLMTAHRSKGLEFEHVYIIGAYDGHWGNKNKRELLRLLPGVYSLIENKKENDFDYLDGKNDDEERRLFYVALTRAKKEVHITYSEFGDDGRERVPSQFVGEIEDSLIDIQDVGHHEKDAGEKKEILFKEKVLNPTKEDIKERYKEFVREKFLSQPLSVSALNNYLKSPWLYFYRNLVRLPEKQNKYQVYGTLIHSVLEKFYTKAGVGEKMSLPDMLSFFESELQKASVNKSDKEDLLDKGHVCLEAWYQKNKDNIPERTQTEFRIPSVNLTEDIRLTGVLDRLDYLDGSDTRVRVVDYKTGKVKSENYIKGETKDSTGDYYRQIVFYKLLLSLDKNGRRKMEEGILQFVEPNDKGEIKEFTFNPTDEEVDELKETIKKVADEILNLKFWDEPCDPKALGEGNERYCELVEEMKKRS